MVMSHRFVHTTYAICPYANRPTRVSVNFSFGPQFTGSLNANSHSSPRGWSIPSRAALCSPCGLAARTRNSPREGAPSAGDIPNPAPRARYPPTTSIAAIITVAIAAAAARTRPVVASAPDLDDGVQDDPTLPSRRSPPSPRDASSAPRAIPRAERPSMGSRSVVAITTTSRACAPSAARASTRAGPKSNTSITPHVSAVVTSSSPARLRDEFGSTPSEIFRLVLPTRDAGRPTSPCRQPSDL